MKKFLAGLIILVLCISGCAQTEKTGGKETAFESRFDKENVIKISDEKAEMNGKTIGESGDVFLSHDIIYYEDKDTYESGNPYGEGETADKHSKEEADKHTVINITKSGAYRISGKLSTGQIRIDLGEDAGENPDAAVELILDNADITCTVAPAVLFMNVYECDEDASEETATSDVDTSKAGAVLVLADGSKNNINGAYVATIFKDADGEKKLWKQDGAIYSYMSMNVCGGGELNLNAANEGLDTELHLTINSGNINICSQNDGINTNEDNISVTTINGGNVNIMAGLGEEGDGIDSNGWLVINGGNVVSNAKPIADSGLDSDKGSFVNGGTVVALGSTMDWPESDSGQVTINLQFADAVPHGSTIAVKDETGNAVFEYNIAAETNLAADRQYRGIILSCPNFEQSDKYTLYVNDVQQGYYGSDIKMPGRKPDENFPHIPTEKPQMPKGEKPPKFDGEMQPEFENGRAPQFNGENMPMMPWDRGMDYEGQEQKTTFVMTDKVNLFTGVSAVK